MHSSIRSALILVLLAAACGDGDVATQPDTGETFRPEPPGPTFDAGRPEPTADAADEPDLTGCPVSTCSPGAVRCQGAGVQTCEDLDADSCGSWSAVVDCQQPGEVCIDGACAVPMGCVDNDRDGFGIQCDGGPDCDDSDATANPDGVEVCDGADNNCDGTVDEGFQVGMACTVGTGTCESTGMTACAPDGTTHCDAPPPATSAEVCDGLDNDCNGMVDDGVCSGCSTDVYEPNDTLADATPINVGTPIIGLMCPNEVDFIHLETQPNKQYRLNVAYPIDLSNLVLTPYIDGTAAASTSSSGDDWVAFNVDTSIAGDVSIEIKNSQSVETFFRVGLVESSQLRCADEDGFAPNQRIQDAFPLLLSWNPYVYMCPSTGGLNNRVSDWYHLGEVQMGQRMTLETLEDEGFFSDDYDLDIYLWADPDGDNTYTVEKSTATFNDNEIIIHTAGHTGRRFLEVRDYDGAGGPYWVGWAVN